MSDARDRVAIAQELIRMAEQAGYRLLAVDPRDKMPEHEPLVAWTSYRSDAPPMPQHLREVIKRYAIDICDQLRVTEELAAIARDPHWRLDLNDLDE